ncbi:MAG: tRNA lysidine(34) synthetase TilS [Sphingobacteriales bacterium]|nr:MAG: tRNA lysidine(34) synthetase TilS [Sphingobacteriales bacterium]
MQLLARFKDHWKKEQYAAPGQALLLAVSGGRDSMVLAHLLKASGISFAIGHCNFSLRDEESDDDEQLVKDWAIEKGISFFTTRFDTAAQAKSMGKGIQETARILRYTWLEQVRTEKGFAAIATAHHAHDNAETMLINLFKGTGIAGLHGIRHRHGHLIRPLLFATREEIREYAAVHQVPFREDSSNSSDKYLRNAVRLNIIPAIENYFPAAVQQMNETIRRLAEAEVFYRKEITRQIKKLKEQRGKDIFIPVLKLLKYDAPETICYELFREYGFHATQTGEILKLALSDSGKWMESGSHKLIRDRGFLILTEKTTTATDFILIPELPATVQAEALSFQFARLDARPEVSADQSTACIDASQVEFPLILRRWRQGDYFYPLGMGMKKKKLSRFFIDQKLPVHKKEAVWVLESNKRIVWVAGLRLDERFKLRPSTTACIRVTVR